MESANRYLFPQVDDFLLITSKKAEAERFLSVMHEVAARQILIGRNASELVCVGNSGNIICVN
jgi:hypothetical protein